VTLNNSYCEISVSTVATVAVEQLTLRGSYNHTAVVQQDVSFSCKLLKNGNIVINLHQVGEPYRIFWNFTGSIWNFTGRKIRVCEFIIPLAM
jgi:hypothetical protein